MKFIIQNHQNFMQDYSYGLELRIPLVFHCISMKEDIRNTYCKDETSVTQKNNVNLISKDSKRFFCAFYFSFFGLTLLNVHSTVPKSSRMS